MGSVFRYSGLTTKVRAMRGRLLTKEEYKIMSNMSSVAEVINMLKERKSYMDIFEGKDPEYIHRGELEKLMLCSKYIDFEKLYRFANSSQRPYLKLYFIKYEIDIIKKAIVHLDNPMQREFYNDFDKIVGKYPDTDIAKVCNASNMDELIEAVKGSIFFNTIQMVRNCENAKAFDYEVALDLFFFTYVWKKRKKFFKGDDLENVSKIYGTESDILNIMWIHRTKEYYRLKKEQIYSMVIPVYYKLKKEQIRQLVEVEGEDAFWGVVESSYYGKLLKKEEFNSANIGKIFDEYLRSCYHKLFKINPYSLSALTAYLRDKEAEIKKIVTVAESIRYGYSSEDILKRLR